MLIYYYYYYNKSSPPVFTVFIIAVTVALIIAPLLAMMCMSVQFRLGFYSLLALQTFPFTAMVRPLLLLLLRLDLIFLFHLHWCHFIFCETINIQYEAAGGGVHYRASATTEASLL